MSSVDPTTLQPDYLNANQGPKLDEIIIFVFALAVIAVFLRFLARILTKASLWWDDWAVLVAVILAVGPFALTVILVENNFGKHVKVAGVPAVLMFNKCLYAFEIVYPLPIAMTKISILLYYRRLFRVQSIKMPIYLVSGLICCWLIYVEAAAIFTCTPIRKMWDTTVVGGHCIDIQKSFIGIAVPNIVTDIALLALPLPYIWRLQVKLPQKVAVTFVFILGGFVAVVSIIRLTVLLNLGDDPDVTWTYVPTCIWTNIEVHIGIVTASVPAFWPLLRALVTGSVKAVTKRGTHSTGGDNSAKSIPTFITRTRCTKNSSNVQDDEEGFVHLKEMQSESPAPSRQVVSDREDWASNTRRMRMEQPEKMTRIQVRKDWTVSSNSMGSNYEHERSFKK